MPSVGDFSSIEETFDAACPKTRKEKATKSDGKSTGTARTKLLPTPPRSGGSIAGNARKEIEATTGKPVVTSKNAADFSNLITNLIEDTGKDGERS